MYRPLAFICALCVSLVAVSTTCLAQSSDWIRFTLEPESGNPAKIHASFHHQERGGGNNNWSTALRPSELIGLEVSSFHGSGTRQLHFSIVREAGRLDCAGNGGSNFASGSCRFSENPAFSELLASRGIGHATSDQMFGLMAVNARRDLIDSLAAARYPAPHINDLIALSALGVNGEYIGAMSRAGYRPHGLQSLIDFKALGITPDWIAGFARVGYANVSGDGLVQMRALGITPEFVAAYQRIGYRNLPIETLVQLKALDITPEFVRAVAGPGQPMPPVNKLVELRMFAKRH
jgi:hypothetical protein